MPDDAYYQLSCLGQPIRVQLFLVQVLLPDVGMLPAIYQADQE